MLSNSQNSNFITELKSPDLISDGESGFSHNELTPQHNYSFKVRKYFNFIF